MTDSDRISELAESAAIQAQRHPNPEDRLVQAAKTVYNEIPEREKKRLATSVPPVAHRDRRFRSDLAYEIFRRGIKKLSAAPSAP